MQTLTAGSFLNLENPEAVERLEFTAQRLAEMTTAVVKENLTAAALKNLANDLWQKAEYVARETERRRLHEIFVENFCERFRELKPEVSASIPSFQTQPAASLARDVDSTEQPPATVESVSTPELPAGNTTAVQGKKDEFLGFVKTDEPFVESPATEREAAIPAVESAPEKTEQELAQTALVDEPIAAETKVATENPNETNRPQAVAPVADAKSIPQAATTSAIKTSAAAPKTADALKEPFEFGKCTASLNLTLLPASGDGRGRRAIVSAASHNLPPEIEFIEIGDGEDSTEIAALVKDKLERFKQTLPAKYIEQLRASKTKTAKKPATSKLATTVATATKPEIAQANGAKTSGEQQARNLSDAETEKSRTEIAASKENLAAQTAPIVPLPQPQVTAANNVQPSLF